MHLEGKGKEIVGMNLLLRELEDGSLRFRRPLGYNLNFTSRILTIAGLTESRIPSFIHTSLDNPSNYPIAIHRDRFMQSKAEAPVSLNILLL